jgi:hypothetical protein
MLINYFIFDSNMFYLYLSAQIDEEVKIITSTYI